MLMKNVIQPEWSTVWLMALTMNCFVCDMATMNRHSSYTLHIYLIAALLNVAQNGSAYEYLA